jgi:glycosyltransferase involved in cell wall biosynthesis
MNLKITVVVPLFNKAANIGACLNSLQKQTVRPYEIIVIDDGSTDKSYDIAKYELSSYQGKCRLIQQKNAGVSVARNVGADMAETEFVAFLDADDLYYPEFIDKSIKLIKDFPDCALYCFGHKIKDDEIGVFTPRNGLPVGFRGLVADFFKASTKGPIAKSSKIVVRKNTLLQIGGFPEGKKTGEDLYVWIMLALNGKVAYDDFKSTLVVQEPDQSRFGRKGSILYPLIFFAESQNKKKLTQSAYNYLWHVTINTVVGSKLNFDSKTALLKVRYALKIFGCRAFLLLSLVILPQSFFKALKKYKRKKLSSPI